MTVAHVRVLLGSTLIRHTMDLALFLLFLGMPFLMILQNHFCPDAIAINL